MNKQRKVVITTTYNEMGIIIDTKAEKVAQPKLQPTCNQLATDTISRQAAIDALKEHRALYCDNTPDTFSKLSYAEKSRVDELDTAIATLVNLPSAQPETRTFVELVVEYPDPELCTYKEFKGKPYYSIKYIENGETYVGYGTYKPEVLSRYLRECFMPSAQPEEPQWIPCERELPEVGRSVLISVGGMYTAEGCLREDGDWTQFRWDTTQRKDMVGAWKPLDEPWRGEEHDEMGG